MSITEKPPVSIAKKYEGTSLRKGRLGVAGIVFFVVAASAPMAGMTGVVPVAGVLGNGAAVPGAYVFVGLILLLFSVGFTAMSHEVTNAGAFFAYVGKGLGVNIGVGSAFLSILAYITVQLAIYGFFGSMMELTFGGMGIHLPWYVWCAIGWIGVTILSLLRVDIGAKILGVLTGLEVLSMLVVAAAILFSSHLPEGINVAASFAPANVFAGGFAGTAGIAITFAFASFIGFESTAIYGEESINPKKTVRRATYWAIGIIAGLFTIVTFAMTTGMGASNVVKEILQRSTVGKTPLADPSAVLFSLATHFVGPWMAQLMGCLVLTSLFAGLLAFQNATSRYFFAMGRGGVLPAVLARTNRRGAPFMGVALTSTIAIVVIVLFAIFKLDPVLNLFYWLSSVSVLAIVLVEILVSIAVIVHFVKTKGSTLWQGKIAPALAVLGMGLAVYLLLSRFNLLAGTSADGVDPSLPGSAFQMNPLGWFLVLLPFLIFVVGVIVGFVNKKENASLTEDILS